MCDKIPMLFSWRYPLLHSPSLMVPIAHCDSFACCDTNYFALGMSYDYEQVAGTTMAEFIL